MSLKLNLKTGLFRVLQQLPATTGLYIYHQFQQILSKTSLASRVKSSFNSYRTFKILCEKHHIETEKKHIIEIGSGWLPVIPYFFRFLSNASKITTYDLNRHYQKKRIGELNQYFAESYKVDIGETTTKYLLAKDVDYRPETNIIKEEALVGDIIFSRFVLEHVTPGDMKQMHEKFKCDLKPGTHIIHLISPSDHRAYTDKSLSLQDFLKYSKKEWDRKQTKFDYHNRMRLPQYLELFKSCGLEVVGMEYDVPAVDSASYKKFKTLKIHPDYQQYSDRELMAGAINIVLKV